MLANRFGRGGCPCRQRFARHHRGFCCGWHYRAPWPWSGRMHQGSRSNRRCHGSDDRFLDHNRRRYGRNNRRRRHRRWRRSWWSCWLLSRWGFGWLWLGRFGVNSRFRRPYLCRGCGGFGSLNRRLSFRLCLSYLDLGFDEGCRLRWFLFDFLAREVVLNVLNALSINIAGSRDSFNPLSLEVGNNLQRFDLEFFR